MEFPVLQFGLRPQRCAVCASTSRLLHCRSCKVISYCGAAHQSAHRSKHEKECTTIRKSREALEAEELALQTHPGDLFLPKDPLNSARGRFWGIVGTRDYMRARFAAAEHLLKVNTFRAIETALWHFQEMLRLNRSDNMGLRDIIPGLLLRLGQEQNCYDFLKWWATVDNKGNYDWGDVTLPFLDIRNADAFESIGIFSNCTNLSHLAVLTLLKLRLRLDLDAMPCQESDFDVGFQTPDPQPDRPLGEIVSRKMQARGIRNVEGMIEVLETQYRQLCGMVNDMNPYFWDELGDEETPSPPAFYSAGTKEEAELALHHCKAVWQESEDAIVMIEGDTCRFTAVYRPSVTAANLVDPRLTNPLEITRAAEKTRGTGGIVPSVFKPPAATSTPAELFPATGRGQTIRFICRTDDEKVLVYADGACSNNSQSHARGGWAVICGPPDPRETPNPYVVSGRLETQGPFGDELPATSNRAELRAAIAALRLCDWQSEGFRSIVIASDSSYVVDGATSWVKGWVRNKWKTSKGYSVKNRDLWELLLGEAEKINDRGMAVTFWKIPRGLNRNADAAAKRATELARVEVSFRDMVISRRQAATPGTGRGRRVLALCLEYEAVFDEVFGSLVSHITSKADVVRATTQETALRLLDQLPPPAIILVADGAITRRKKLLERVIDHLHEGATVMLAGCFSSGVTAGEFNRLFAKIGLPWKRGSYDRTTVSLRANAIGGPLVRRLPSAYSQKCVFANNVEGSSIWYASSETSSEAAVALAQIGNGKLGYIGDVNGEDPSDVVVLVMCGLLD